MAFYQGTVKKQDLFNVIINKLTTAPTGALEPYWKAVQSAPSEGVILHSTGSSGLDNVYVRLRPQSGDGYHNWITLSMMEGYTPDPVQGIEGVPENESVTANVMYAYTNIYYRASYPVDYWLTFDKDKIILSLKGDPAVHSSIEYCFRSMAWIGLPERLTNEPDSTSASFACSRYSHQLTTWGSTHSGNASQCRTLQNRTQVNQSYMYMRFAGSNFPSKGWGDHVLLSKIYLEDIHQPEGIRAIMDGVHPVWQSSGASFQDGDEIAVGTKRYTVMLVQDESPYYNTNCFPSYWMAVEQLA